MFTETQINKIIHNWGQDIYAKLLHEIPIYSKKWELSDLCFFDNYSMNAIFFCKSKVYGDCVLKIGNGFQNNEFISEYNVLREYNGRRFVKIFESDIDVKEETKRKAMLIERIIPGVTLQSEPVLEKRLSVFSDLYTGLHVEPNNPALYQTYADKIDYYADIIGKRDDCQELYSHMLRAKDIYDSVSMEYPKQMLLHGDLHFNNILSGDNGSYTIIDPQGLVGDPVFDIPRYIMIEYYHYLNTIEDYHKNKEKSLERRTKTVNEMIEILKNRLGIPDFILRRCFYIEMVTMECWDASVGNYDIDNVIFAETVMNC